MKKWMKTHAVMLCIGLIFAILLPFPAAAGTVAGLSLKYEHAGVEFKIYQVTDANGTMSAAFEKYGVPFECGTNEKRQRTALRLAEIVGRDGIKETEAGTVKEGRLNFTGLEAGWYLVCGEPLRDRGYIYKPAPFLAELKAGRAENADVKADREEDGTEPTRPDDPTEPSRPDDPTEPSKPDSPDEPTDPDTPTSPTKPDSSGGSDSSDNSSGGTKKPVITDSNKPGPGNPGSSLSSFTESQGPASVDVITTDNRASLENEIPQIPKLGDMGLTGYVCGIAASLLLMLFLLLLRRRLDEGEEIRR